MPIKRGLSGGFTVDYIKPKLRYRACGSDKEDVEDDISDIF
jgi:hypothetical protein